MGFKRTSEGRVFFQGTEEGGAAKKADFRNLQQTSAPQTTQLQILSLLRALNDKLKDAQTDRTRMRAELDAYRTHIEDLESKLGKTPAAGNNKAAERAEKMAADMFKELDKEIKETRKLILDIEDKTDKADKGVLTLQRQMIQAKGLGEELAKQQEKYNELTKRFDVADTRHEDLTNRVEKTSAEQARIARQIEKVAEDRMRFMRKIERIEETVIQTRDALSSKAMVLLTEQGAQTAASASTLTGTTTIVDQVMAARPTVSERLITQDSTRWQDSFPFQVAVALLVLGLGVAGGWAVSKIRAMSTDTETASAEYQQTETTNDVTEAEPTRSATLTSPEQTAPAPTEAATDETGFYDSNANQATEQTAPENQTFSASEETAAANDIGAVDVMDTKKLEQMLESNPDAVAAALNNIEPGNETPAAPKTEEKIAAVENDINPPITEPVKVPAKEKPAAEKPAATKTKAKDMGRDASLPDEAKKIEEKAYEGMPEAQHDLAAIYTAGQGGVKQDYKRAAYWFEKAGNQGVANASYNLGVLYHQGLGTKPNINEAINWYKKAATQGHPEAQYNLGIAYIEGIGVGYDPQKAADNFEKAAKSGIVEAAYNLGLIYENGLLGSPEPQSALKWYKTAADRGSPEAKEALEQLAKNLDVKVEDVKRVADGVPEAKAPAPRQPLAKNDQDLMLQIQKKLVTEGLFPGPADGVGGALTEDAIRAYQMKYKLPADGRPSEDLLRHMMN